MTTCSGPGPTFSVESGTPVAAGMTGAEGYGAALSVARAASAMMIVEVTAMSGKRRFIALDTVEIRRVIQMDPVLGMAGPGAGGAPV